jgi:23S rRNA pseudouridine2604 synthase
MNHPKRIFPVGRLDKDSEGLILLTNDGDIVNKILRAGNNNEKEYVVSVDKELTPEMIRQMGNGVKILGERTKPCYIRQEGQRKFRIILKQGLNRQIRRMCAEFGYKVKDLKRIRIMHIQLGNLATGKWRYLTPAEIEQLDRLLEKAYN